MPKQNKTNLGNKESVIRNEDADADTAAEREEDKEEVMVNARTDRRASRTADEMVGMRLTSETFETACLPETDKDARKESNCGGHCRGK